MTNVIEIINVTRQYEPPPQKERQWQTQIRKTPKFKVVLYATQLLRA